MDGAAFGAAAAEVAATEAPPRGCLALLARARQRRRRCRRGGSGDGRAGISARCSHRGARAGQHAFHVDGFIRFDDDARVQLAGRDLIYIQTIRLVLEIQSLNIQALPIDEIFVQRVVDGVQIRDA